MVQTQEERIAALEAKSVELETLVGELRQELARRRMLDELHTDVAELKERYRAHEIYVSERMTDFERVLVTRVDVMEDNLTRDIGVVRGEVAELKQDQSEILSLLRQQFGTNGHD